MVYYRRAAVAGDARAQTNLGNYYLAGGEEGENVDWAEAARWLRKAAAQGEVVAEYNLATMYIKGGHG